MSAPLPTPRPMILCSLQHSIIASTQGYRDRERMYMRKVKEGLVIRDGENNLMIFHIVHIPILGGGPTGIDLCVCWAVGTNSK